MSNKKILTILFLSLFLISFVFASDIKTIKQNEEATLYQMCSNCTYVNITSIKYPNSSVLIIGEGMNKSGEDYTYSFSDTSNVGNYYYNVCGDKDGISKCEVISFEVTATGYSQSTSQGIGSFGYLLLIIILMFVFGYIGFKFFQTENWWILGVFFEFMALIFLVYNSWLGYQYHKFVTGLPTSNIPETLFYMLLFILVVGSLTCLALLFRHWRKIFRYIKKEIKRKEEDDSDLEDWDVDRWGGETWNINKNNSWDTKG